MVNVYAFEIKTLVLVEAETEDEAWDKVQDATRSAVGDFIYEISEEDSKIEQPPNT